MSRIHILLHNGVEVMKGEEWQIACYLKDQGKFSISYAFKHEGYEMRTFRQHIISEVTEELANEPWFDGVCCDKISLFREDWEKIDQAIEEVKADTIFWGAPNCGLQLEGKC